MKAPSPVSAPIDLRRYRYWLSEFTSYRHQITQSRIELWLEQFQPQHKDLAARVLDCVDFISQEQMFSAYRSLLSSINGWSIDPTLRHGRWCFVAFSSSAGESGDEMLHKFRVANNLSLKKYNHLFIHKSELMSAKLSTKDTVIFIDDFSGTGKQVCDTWKIIEELLPGEPRIFLFLIAVSHSALARIRIQTEINCVPHITLNDSDNIFSKSCPYFSVEDRAHLLKYCRKASSKTPKGFGDCGFVIVFSHSCPNNSIPILHMCHANWEGLFRRYDNFERA